MVDLKRPEIATEDKNDVRELMVRAWYPAEIAETNKPEPFLREIEPLSNMLGKSKQIPEFIFSHLQDIPSHSYLNASIVNTTSKFPVLFFSPGNKSFASQNTLLMEHLASNGYVILAIDHPYQSSVVKFPSGKVIYYNYQNTAQPKQPSKKDTKKFMKAIAYGPYEAYYEYTKTMLEGIKSHDKIQIRSEDVLFVLNELEHKKAELAPIANVVDFDRIGIFGMSAGGATAGKICVEDKRFKAGVNMDGTQNGYGSINYVLEKPFMMMNHDERPVFSRILGDEFEENKLLAFEMNDFLLHQSKSTYYNLVIDGSVHFNFSDGLIMMQNIGSWTGVLGEIDPWVMKDILDDFILAFFNKHLKELDEPLLNDYSEKHSEIAKFEVKNTE